MSAESWLEGYISVMAALEAGSREVTAVYAQREKWRRDRRLRRLQQAAQAAGVSLEFVDAQTVAAAAGGQSHGGLVARVGARRFASLGDLIDGQERPFVAMLDGIEDPYNFGQAVRALYAAGVSGVVVRPRNWLSTAAVVARASAGASERVLMAVAQTVEAAAGYYRQRGLAVACTGRDATVSLYGVDLAQPLFVLLGGEKRGVTRSFMRQADLLLAIPYARPFDQSLGTVAATAAIAFERQRQIQHVQKAATDCADFTD